MCNIFGDNIWVAIYNSTHSMAFIQQLCKRRLGEGEWNVFFFACMYAATCMARCKSNRSMSSIHLIKIVMQDLGGREGFQEWRACL